MVRPRRTSADAGPDISLVMPCYNEEEVVGYTITRLLAAFERSGYRLQIVAVDNGSHDGTGSILLDFAGRSRSVTSHRVEENRGYGFGVRSGIPLCTAPWVGIIPADGQVDAEDVVRLYESVANAPGPVLAKVRRRFRMDGLLRKLVSVSYNLFVLALWPRLGTLDVNGSPKLVRRDLLLRLALVSDGWFFDPELMIKAHALGVRTLELNVFARMRGAGLSHVRVGTCWEFFRDLLRYRFGIPLDRWRRGIANESPARAARSVEPASSPALAVSIGTGGWRDAGSEQVTH
ncbi:MAG: glycosyltransferase family 2 protein [Gemmatimonadaceae bacterium]